MTEKRLFVSVEGDEVSLVELEIDSSTSDGATHTPREYEKIKASFEKLLQELYDMGLSEELREERASYFLRVHGTWLYSLAKTGFAIDYSQWQKEKLGVATLPHKDEEEDHRVA